ncbi:MAG: FAD-dependent oxidoreductase [Elusimicrobia bacterium]|nr:FAD-dependent oxidoreductase [Elusimicrobiota bacterium]
MSRDYDLVIVGAGITGLGLFERAAEAGLSCLLLERGSVGGATTAVTSGLFHGGLRYLPYDAATSWRMCREIQRLRAESPELMSPQRFLWPVYREDRWGPVAVGAVLDYYDLFAELRGAPRHERLTAEGALRLLPGLRREGLLGAFVFEEWKADVPGLVRRLARRGASAGGTILEGAKAVAFERSGSVVAGVQTLDAEGRRELHRGRVLVNAAGPWADEVARLAGARAPLRLRAGAHLVLAGEPPPLGLIFQGPGGRIIGLYPREQEAWVGPTDSEFRGGPDEACAEPGEGRALRESVARLLSGSEWRPGRLAVGLRPIFRQAGAGPLLSRDHRVIDHAAEGLENLVTVVGGKLTTYRPMAEEALELVARKLGRPGLEARRRRETTRLGRLLASRRRPASLALSLGLLGYFLLRRAARSA